MDKFTSFLAVFLFILVAWALSENRRAIDKRLVVVGVMLQFAFALIILKTAFGAVFFEYARLVFDQLFAMSDKGAEFVFGSGFKDHFFAFKILPTIIFISAFFRVLFYLGIMQKVVEAMAWVMKRTMHISGAESLVCAANVFCGQTEAPLVIRPYLKHLTSSELLCMMTGGMATVAGGVLAAFVGFGIDAGHLLAASVMSAPAAIVIAKILKPETEKSVTDGALRVEIAMDDVNLFDALCAGAADGLKLALHVAAMLIAVIAFVALVNALLAFVFMPFGIDLSLEKLFSWLFLPVAYLLGVPSQDVFIVARLLGEKIVLNEFVAYIHLGELKAELSERSVIILTYALCGFANFSSVAIQIGGIGELVPEKKRTLAKYGLTAMLGGTLAALMTAAIAGVLI
jgi:concentrative nucleoside transporter, CNT family